MAADDSRSCRAEQIVADRGALAEDGSFHTLRISRLMVDGVVEAPNGAHFTECPPDYGRDEAFQKEYARDREVARGVGRRSRPKYLDVDEADYQARAARRSDQ